MCLIGWRGGGCCLRLVACRSYSSWARAIRFKISVFTYPSMYSLSTSRIVNQWKIQSEHFLIVWVNFLTWEILISSFWWWFSFFRVEKKTSNDYKGFSALRAHFLFKLLIVALSVSIFSFYNKKQRQKSFRILINLFCTFSKFY